LAASVRERWLIKANNGIKQDVGNHHEAIR